MTGLPYGSGIALKPWAALLVRVVVAWNIMRGGSATIRSTRVVRFIARHGIEDGATRKRNAKR